MNDKRLREWTLATFHTTLFFTAFLLVLYLAGTLGGLLESLNTLLGVAAFGVFWATTWWTTRRALAGVEWPKLQDQPPIGAITTRGAYWGGVNGALVFLLGLLPVVVNFFLSDPSELFNVLAFAGLVGLFGSAVAVIVGAIVGFLLALVDSVVLSVVQRVAMRRDGGQGKRPENRYRRR